MSTTFSRLELKEIAKYHKSLLWSVLVFLIALSFGRSLEGKPAIVVYVYLVMLLGGGIFQLLSLCRLLKALKPSLVFIFLLFLSLFIFPLFYPLMLLFTYYKATKVMKDAGVKVGFFGADSNSI